MQNCEALSHHLLASFEPRLKVILRFSSSKLISLLLDLEIQVVKFALLLFLEGIVVLLAKT